MHISNRLPSRLQQSQRIAAGPDRRLCSSAAAGGFGKLVFSDLQVFHVPAPDGQVVRYNFGEIDHCTNYRAILCFTHHYRLHCCHLGIDSGLVSAEPLESVLNKLWKMLWQVFHFSRRCNHGEQRVRRYAEQQSLAIDNNPVDIPVTESSIGKIGGACCRVQNLQQLLRCSQYDHVSGLDLSAAIRSESTAVRP